MAGDEAPVVVHATAYQRHRLLTRRQASGSLSRTGSGRNQIAIAKDKRLLRGRNPIPSRYETDGPKRRSAIGILIAFIGDTYYAISGGESPFKSKIEELTLVGDFVRHDASEVAYGEDISPNFLSNRQQVDAAASAIRSVAATIRASGQEVWAPVL
jgi:hypothetical protein